MRHPDARQMALVTTTLAIGINLVVVVLDLLVRRWHAAGGLSAGVAAAVAVMHWVQTAAHARQDAWLREHAWIERRMAAETAVSEEISRRVRAGEAGIEIHGERVGTRH